MKLADRKKNLDVLVKHFSKHPHILKAMKHNKEDVDWLHAQENEEKLESKAEEHKELMSGEEPDEKGPIKSLEHLKKVAKEKGA